MSYYIYCIAYRITDEIRAKKEAEKPFWWEHLHESVRDKPIDEIERMILDGGVPKEKLDEMTKYEKYMAVSEGCYTIDKAENGKHIAEIETLKKELERNKTSFLSNSLNNSVNSNSRMQMNQDFKPIDFSKSGELPVTDTGSSMPSEVPPIDPMAMKLADESSFMGSSAKSSGSMDIDDEHIKILSDNVNDDDLLTETKQVGSSSGSIKPEVRKYAQSIVSQTVQQINNKADEIPDDVALMKEQELLQAVINELQTLR